MKNDSKLPYFCWYPADAETDSNYSAMDDAELGFYHRCLNYSWRNGGLPADAKERARALKRTKPYADKKWIRVGKCFFPSKEDPALLVNPRQEKERQKAFSRNRRATDAANARHKTVARSNAYASPKQCLEDAKALPRAYDSDSDSDSESLKKLATEVKTSTRVPDFEPFADGEFVLSEWIEKLYRQHPKKKAKPLAEEACRRIFLSCQRDGVDPDIKFAQIFKAHAAWCTTDQWTKDDAMYCPQLGVWLDDDGYLAKVPRGGRGADPPEETDSERRAREARERETLRARGVIR